MTKDNLNINELPPDEMDGKDLGDSQLEQMLKAAYESAGPTAEQEERMLTALLEAQASAKAQNDGETAPKIGGQPNAANRLPYRLPHAWRLAPW